jgi:hypothetical protein
MGDFEDAMKSLAEGIDDASEELGMPRSRGGRPEMSGPSVVGGGPPGWRAFRFAWDLLVDGDTWSNLGDDARPAILGLTSLTNFAMLAAVLVLLAGRARRGLGVLLLVCAALDAAWIYLTDSDLREGLRAGYYLWLGSFALVGAGMLGAARTE